MSAIESGNEPSTPDRAYERWLGAIIDVPDNSYELRWDEVVPAMLEAFGRFTWLGVEYVTHHVSWQVNRPYYIMARPHDPHGVLSGARR